MTLLVWITAILAAVLVGVLVGYLVMTALMLTRAHSDLKKIATALERAAEQGEPIKITVEAIDAWVGRLSKLGRRIAGPERQNTTEGRRHVF